MGGRPGGAFSTFPLKTRPLTNSAGNKRCRAGARLSLGRRTSRQAGHGKSGRKGVLGRHPAAFVAAGVEKRWGSGGACLHLLPSLYSVFPSEKVQQIPFSPPARTNRKKNTFTSPASSGFGKGADAALPGVSTALG